jgi:urea transport system substrate-binding protein
MAPEQAAGDDDVGPRADVYSLGAILYQLLTDRAPFEGKSDWQVLNAVLHRPPTPPREVQPDIPAELEAICLRCLEKSPGRRYPTAAALADDLHRFLDGAAVGPRPDGPRRLLQGTAVGPRPAGPRRLGRGVALAGAVLLTALLVPGILFLLRPPQPAAAALPPIRLGILRPTAGPSFTEGAAMVEAALLAIDEINVRGGMLGRRVREVFLDTGTERDGIPDATWRQLDSQRGLVLLGCLAAQARETIRPSLKALDSLLIYLGPADGVLPSEYVVSLRPTPAQSVLPVVDWLLREQGRRRLFLVGSDSLYPRAAFEMLRQRLRENPPVGEAYLPESETQTRKIVDAIPKGPSEPDVILNLLHDDATPHLLREAYAADFRPPRTVVVTLRFGETVLRYLREPQPRAAGQYLVGNYFPDLPGPANAHFKNRLLIKYGDPRPADDTAVAAYVGVHLWAKAVEKAGTDNPAAVRRAIGGLSYDGPAGPVRVDPGTGYSRSVVRVARVEKGDTFRVEPTWAEPHDPAPFYGHPPEERYWEFLLDYWHRTWSGRAGPPRWFNPGGNTRILPVIPDEAGGFVR